MKNETFTVTEDHLKLARRMFVDWWDMEYGAPCIDPKRPYGNGSVEDDICEILEKKKVSVDYDEAYRTEDLESAAKIHKEMQITLQIFLCTQSFAVGTYKKKQEYNDTSWEKRKL